MASRFRGGGLRKREPSFPRKREPGTLMKIPCGYILYDEMADTGAAFTARKMSMLGFTLSPGVPG